MRLCSPASILLLSTVVSGSGIRQGYVEEGQPHHLTKNVNWSRVEGFFQDVALQGDCPILEKWPTTSSEDERFKNAFRPCGYYKAQGCPYQVIEADKCYPGQGSENIHEYDPFITQFDIGIYPALKSNIWNSTKKFQKEWCVGCKENLEKYSNASDPKIGHGPNIGDMTSGETCIEAIVRAGNSRDDATLEGCAGKCGAGCSLLGGGWAKDCLKHDICVTYKYFVLGKDEKSKPSGFCADLDCGDEGAQTLMNCYKDVPWWFDTPIICDKGAFENDTSLYGDWSWVRAMWNEGNCGIFKGWSNGQGIPDKNRIRDDNEFMAYLESQGIDVSASRN